VVQPGVEADVAKIVRIPSSPVGVLLQLIGNSQKVHYANAHEIDFMVVNSAHSLTRDSGTFDGIQIHVRSLTGISMFPETGTVRLQAGVSNDQVTRALFAKDYVTSECSKIWIE
jgi:hypothetical protein